MYLGKELVTGTKIRKIQVQNLATGESDYYYFGEPCDEGDIMNAMYQILANIKNDLSNRGDKCDIATIQLDCKGCPIICRDYIPGFRWESIYPRS